MTSGDNLRNVKKRLKKISFTLSGVSQHFGKIKKD